MAIFRITLRLTLKKMIVLQGLYRDRLYRELSYDSILSRVTYRDEWLAENTVVCERPVSILAVHRSHACERVHRPVGTRHCDRRYMVKHKLLAYAWHYYEIARIHYANHKPSILIFSQAELKISAITDPSK